MYPSDDSPSIPSPSASGSSSPALPDDPGQEMAEAFAYGQSPTEDEMVEMYLSGLRQQLREERRDSLRPLPTSTLLAWAAAPAVYAMAREPVEQFAADVADELAARGVTARAA